jgi:hypothetical protein
MPELRQHGRWNQSPGKKVPKKIDLPN